VLSIIFFNFHFLQGKLLNGFLGQEWDTKTHATHVFHVIPLSHAEILTLAALIVVLGTLLDLERTYKSGKYNENIG
jgi:hypothetical protein